MKKRTAGVMLIVSAIDGEIDGNSICIYDKERIICDCLCYLGKRDKEIFNKAI